MPADALITLGLLALLAVFFYGPWQEVCTDFTRQIIFERRDRLFDMAAAGKLDFNSEVYWSLRSTLEGAIRFAHELTWPHLVMAIIVVPPAAASGAGLLPNQALAKIEDPEVRKLARRQMDEAMGALFLMAAMKSAVLAPLFGILVAAAYCTRRINVFLAPGRHKGPMVERVLSTIERGSVAHV
jgi:hypothetical protein